MSLTQVKEHIVELTQQERAELRNFLDSLEPSTLSPALNAILERRVSEIRSGQAKLVSGEEMFAELEATA
jgi:putative addiction module component (TIGR02574 family)